MTMRERAEAFLRERGVYFDQLDIALLAAFAEAEVRAREEQFDAVINARYNCLKDSVDSEYMLGHLDEAANMQGWRQMMAHRNPDPLKEDGRDEG